MKISFIVIYSYGRHVQNHSLKKLTKKQNKHFQMKLIYGHRHGSLQTNIRISINLILLGYQEIRNSENKVIRHQQQQNYKDFRGLIELVQIQVLVNIVIYGHNLLLLSQKILHHQVVQGVPIVIIQMVLKIL